MGKVGNIISRAKKAEAARQREIAQRELARRSIGKPKETDNGTVSYEGMPEKKKEDPSW